MQLEKINHSVSKEYEARNESIKIRDSSISEIEGIIMACSMLVGIKTDNIPQGLSMGLLTTFILENLGSYTSKEFLLAFNYVSSGKIELPKGNDHFQTFSPKYLGSVMSAYRDYLSRSTVSVNKEVEEKKYTDEELKELKLKSPFTILDLIVLDLKEGFIKFLLPYLGCYRLLSNHGYIKPKPKKEGLELYIKYKKEYLLNLKSLSRIEKDDLKEFVNNGAKNQHYDKIVGNIQTSIYKDWISQNKNIDLDKFHKEVTEKINELIKQGG